MYCFEAIFFISIVVEFLVTYENPHKKGETIKEIEKIAMGYVYNRFLWDLVPVLPL